MSNTPRADWLRAGLDHPGITEITDDACPCGIGHDQPAYRKILAFFDEVHGDEAHRHHDQLVSLIGAEFGAVAAQLDELEAEHKRQELYPAALAYGGSAALVRAAADIV